MRSPTRGPVQRVAAPQLVGVGGLEPAEHRRGLPGGRAHQLQPVEMAQQGATPRAPTRSRCAGSGPPARRCGSGFPASATPPAPAPARRYARPAAAARAPAPRTRRPGSGGSSGPASPARCAPGCRTGRHGFGRRSRAPAAHAAWWTAPHPAPGRSADSGTTRSPAPAPGACARPTTPDSSPLESKAPPGKSVAGQAPSRGSPIITARRQGRLVLHRRDPATQASRAPAADHH